MGTPFMDGLTVEDGFAAIHTFYSDKSWIEGAAVDQLHQVAKLAGVRKIAAFPDLHIGKYGPVGCAILADRIYPQLVGNDIGCGMSLFALDLPLHKFRIEKAVIKLRALEGPWQGDASHRLLQTGIPSDLHHDTLGTIGGGNHFCEIQTPNTSFDVEQFAKIGASKDQLFLLIHSGSRSLGAQVFSRFQQSGEGLKSQNLSSHAYLLAHDEAIQWAKLNRQVIAERAATALRTSCKLVADSPHNMVEVTPEGYLHRKGAAKADLPFVPLAGSRDALSYLLKPELGRDNALASLAHGAGRKYDRRSMLGRVGTSKSQRRGLERTSFGGRVVCEERQLLIEEAPSAYKDSAQVLDDLKDAKLANPIVSLKPLLTFKKAVLEQDNTRAGKQNRLTERRSKR